MIYSPACGNFKERVMAKSLMAKSFFLIINIKFNVEPLSKAR